MRKSATPWAISVCLFSLVSCAVPRASVVVEPEKKPSGLAAEGEGLALNKPRSVLNDGIRIPTMTDMPEDSELRSVRLTTPGAENRGVIARPPSDEEVPVPEE